MTDTVEPAAAMSRHSKTVVACPAQELPTTGYDHGDPGGGEDATALEPTCAAAAPPAVARPSPIAGDGDDLELDAEHDDDATETSTVAYSRCEEDEEDQESLVSDNLNEQDEEEDEHEIKEGRDEDALSFSVEDDDGDIDKTIVELEEEEEETQGAESTTLLGVDQETEVDIAEDLVCEDEAPCGAILDHAPPATRSGRRLSAAELQARVLSKCRAMLGLRKKPRKPRAYESCLEHEDQDAHV